MTKTDAIFGKLHQVLTLQKHYEYKQKASKTVKLRQDPLWSQNLDIE